MTEGILLATDANNPQVVGSYKFDATAEEKGKQLPRPSGYHILCAIPEAEKQFEEWLEGLRRRGFSSDRLTAVKRMYKALYRQSLTVEQAREVIARFGVKTPPDHC